ncbi:MAG: ATP-binding protein [Chitinophagaceae bacterium]
MRQLFLFLLIFQVFALSAQTEKIAALQASERNAKDLGEILKAEISLLHEHESLYKDSLLPLATRTLKYAEKLKNKTAIGIATLGIIHAHLRTDNVTAADSLIEKSLVQFPLKVAATKEIHLKILLEKTNVLAARADYEKAVKLLFEVIHEAEDAKLYALLSKGFNELGVISYNRNELEKALEYYQKALSYNELNPEKNEASAYAFINIALVDAWQEHYDSALHYIALAKPLCEQIQNLYYLANAYVVEANIYKWSGRMPQAEKAMLQMVALREKTEGSITFSNEQLGLANFYVYAKEYQKAIAIFKSGLEYAKTRTAIGSPSNYELNLRYYEGLAKCYHAITARDDYEDALQHVIAYKDSLNEKNSENAIAEMQTKYEVQKKETTIIAQKLDITRKNILFYGSLGLLALAAIIAWLLFRNYRRKNEMKLFLLQEEEKKKAETAVREAEESERKRIASDLHDNLGSYAASIKSNADELKRNPVEAAPVLDLLQTNAQQMVSLLSDTIWAMRKSSLQLSDISDRVKLMFQRLRPNYSSVHMRVTEGDEEATELLPAHAYHLFLIIQEAVNNALRHSHCHELVVEISGGLEWSVRIRDNGTGLSINPEASLSGNGLINMKARAENMECSLEWKAVLPQGTEVEIRATPF